VHCHFFVHFSYFFITKFVAFIKSIYIGTQILIRRRGTFMDRKKVDIQYQLKPTSGPILWDAISTPSGLESWFADKVTIDGHLVTFYWADEKRVAKLVAIRSYSLIRFKWQDSEYPREYFEIKMLNDELTNDFVLEVVDFADEDEVEDCQQLWDHEVETLCRNYGF